MTLGSKTGNRACRSWEIVDRQPDVPWSLLGALLLLLFLLLSLAALAPNEGSTAVTFPRRAGSTSLRSQHCSACVHKPLNDMSGADLVALVEVGDRRGYLAFGPSSSKRKNEFVSFFVCQGRTIQAEPIR